MMQKKILIVEDEMIIAADISLQLSKVGYEVVGIHTKGEDAIITAKSNPPDLILMDIMLAGDIDGIETAELIENIPIIFLTSNADDATFQRAIKTKPYGFIAKPFQLEQFTRTLQIAFNHIDDINKNDGNSEDHIISASDYLFVRQKKMMVKILIKDILYIEAERNYCMMYTEMAKHLATVPMKTILEHLPSKKFIKVHRSYVVNIEKVDAIGENNETLIINDKSIPVSRRNKSDILKKLTSL